MSTTILTPGEQRRQLMRDRILANYEKAKATQVDSKGRPISDTQIILQMMQSGKYGYCSMQTFRNIINTYKNTND